MDKWSRGRWMCKEAIQATDSISLNESVIGGEVDDFG